MNSLTPALVTQRAAQRLPRVALLLFCAAYVLPGVFGRDPWKNADVSAAEDFNNRPRYDLAAYELQKLFLDADDYVVPPTALRMVPLDELLKYAPESRPTFRGPTRCWWCCSTGCRR